jgi:hypothetical protein
MSTSNSSSSSILENVERYMKRYDYLMQKRERKHSQGKRLSQEEDEELKKLRPNVFTPIITMFELLHETVKKNQQHRKLHHHHQTGGADAATADADAATDAATDVNISSAKITAKDAKRLSELEESLLPLLTKIILFIEENKKKKKNGEEEDEEEKYPDIGTTAKNSAILVIRRIKKWWNDLISGGSSDLSSKINLKKAIPQLPDNPDDLNKLVDKATAAVHEPLQKIEKLLSNDVRDIASSSVEGIMNALSLIPGIGTTLQLWRLLQNVIVIMSKSVTTMAGAKTQGVDLKNNVMGLKGEIESLASNPQALAGATMGAVAGGNPMEAAMGAVAGGNPLGALSGAMGAAAGPGAAPAPAPAPAGEAAPASQLGDAEEEAMGQPASTEPTPAPANAGGLEGGVAGQGGAPGERGFSGLNGEGIASDIMSGLSGKGEAGGLGGMLGAAANAAAKNAPGGLGGMLANAANAAANNSQGGLGGMLGAAANAAAKNAPGGLGGMLANAAQSGNLGGMLGAAANAAGNAAAPGGGTDPLVQNLVNSLKQAAIASGVSPEAAAAKIDQSVKASLAQGTPLNEIAKFALTAAGVPPGESQKAFNMASAGLQAAGITPDKIANALKDPEKLLKGFSSAAGAAADLANMSDKFMSGKATPGDLLKMGKTGLSGLNALSDATGVSKTSMLKGALGAANAAGVTPGGLLKMGMGMKGGSGASSASSPSLRSTKKYKREYKQSLREIRKTRKRIMRYLRNII